MMGCNALPSVRPLASDLLEWWVAVGFIPSFKQSHAASVGLRPQERLRPYHLPQGRADSEGAGPSYRSE